MTVMREIFVDFEDFMIVIFDNMLVLAHDFHDAFEKLKKVIKVCRKKNVVLKMAKSWLGFREVKFFGYEISWGQYKLGEDRKKSIDSIVFPTNKKSMQSFLGSALFFEGFVKTYSEYTAPLTEMVHNDFNWNKSTSKVDYVGAFERLKQAIKESVTLHFPDYDLEWVLRTNASIVACAAVL
jgi:hypothetical protein